MGNEKEDVLLLGDDVGESDDSADPLWEGRCGRKPRSFHRRMDEKTLFLSDERLYEEAAEAMIAGADGGMRLIPFTRSENRWKNI